MFIASVIVTAVYAALLLGSAYGKVVGAQPVVANLTSVGVPRDRIPILAIPLVAAAAGILVGLAVPALGMTAAAGALVYFILAAAAHYRAGAGNHGAVALYLIGAAAVLALQATVR